VPMPRDPPRTLAISLPYSSLERDFCRRRLARQKGPEGDVFAQRPEIRDHYTRELAAKTVFLLASCQLRVSEDWVVETRWIETGCPPLSLSNEFPVGARNGNFRCRDRATKSAILARIQQQRLRKPKNQRRMSLTTRTYCECLFRGHRVCVSRAASGAEDRLTQKSLHSITPASQSLRGLLTD